LEPYFSEEVVQKVLSVSGTVADMEPRITTDIADLGYVLTMRAILVNRGASDMQAMPAQVDFETDLGNILDAMHAAYPLAQVYVMRPWRRYYGTEADMLATWIGNVVGARAGWANLGPDERVFLENGDDGTTYTTDGVHPNAAGYALTAAEWLSALGF
jgi:lysophospholipase L1-like esterase